MPRFDGTGPAGRGPAGRGLGPCVEGANRGFSLLRRGRRGGGRGSRWFDTSLIDDKLDLVEEKNFLEKRLEAIKQQLDQTKIDQ